MAMPKCITIIISDRKYTEYLTLVQFLWESYLRIYSRKVKAKRKNWKSKKWLDPNQVTNKKKLYGWELCVWLSSWPDWNKTSVHSMKNIFKKNFIDSKQWTESQRWTILVTWQKRRKISYPNNELTFRNFKEKNYLEKNHSTNIKQTKISNYQIVNNS